MSPSAAVHRIANHSSFFFNYTDNETKEPFQKRFNRKTDTQPIQLKTKGP